ncbi:Receptor-like serine/threonine-protein kinase ALE2 [Sesamum alatum]|uniref:Receptor-like serine/threonine-protein kinase ALE2 n=1 Tax=Sesamum alatum TaxID=300844 RepID=A0AAE2CMH7_9LAMI|nr:Receptor-like serine/threonine-protein kinase ALE2 [Sesamum alatum]
MELQLSSMLLGFSLILCGFLFQESAGFGLPSLSVASILLPIKLGTPELRLYAGGRRFLLLRNAPSPRRLNVSSNAYAPSTPSPSHRAKKGIHRFGGKFHHFVPDLEPPMASYTWKGPAISPSPSPLPSPRSWILPRPLPLPAIPSKHLNVPSPSPTISPTSSPVVNNKKTLSPLPSLTLPPPPPNRECASVKCTEPLTYTPPGSPCGCVWPIQVRLRFSVSLYTFFPLVSELAEEIAAGIPLDRSQVRVIGADAADQQLEKTTVLINLVPLEEMFKAATAFSIYTKFWKRELFIKTPVFGAYEVLYVRYPGLPPSPPSRPSGSATIDVQPYPGSRNDDGPIKPLGVDVPRGRKTESSKNMVIIIVLSSVTAFVVCLGFILLFLSKSGCCSFLCRQSEQGLISSDRKPSGGGRLLALRSRPSSPSMSFSSSLLACTGTAKVFSIEDIERATDNFDTSRTLGEGGFGLVYGGILDDGRKVAVKVLKRDDQQGSREFLAEVEMLGRLHHRNLVKLIGICAEDQCRCLVYELVPNGSVESHLHGVDKEVAPLDWRARMKIALGAARGLAYLHEDSSPRVIHRDFKSSNILLEYDYTPKVSDFGLARAAMEEGNKHISTHVMGTFGYLAPEYAMTGHLLVKSDVYSYGVVLLELLTGRKPVDLSQPPGQENLVAWARPLLANKEGLETIIDPSLRSDVPLDNFAKVAAIASMCVQPEVSHRPFMGEVVQALKLVCNEFEETREPMSRSCSHEDFSIDIESKHSRISNELVEDLEKCDSTLDTKIALSAVDLKSSSAGFAGQESESFRRQFNSAPLKMGRKRKFWHRLKGLSRGSMSEHEYSLNL